MKRTLTLLYGVSAYLFFLGTFTYAVCFTGNLFVPRTIDNGPQSPIVAAVVINALLLSVFAVQHSVMARQGFKRWWTQFVSWPAERSTYVVAASAALALLVWQWRPIPYVLWDLRGIWAEPVLNVLFWVGWAILLVSTFLVNHFELFGLEQVWSNFRGREFHRPAFKTPGLYKVIRHPIYAGFIIGFWAAPVMSAGHLMLAVATTGYILVGIFFEERDLITAYGEQYMQYRHRVPMLIPFLGPKRESASPTSAPADTARTMSASSD